MKRLWITCLSLLVLVLSAGCDNVNGPDGDFDRASVYSFEFNFDVDDTDLDQSGLVASAQYDVPSITRSVLDNGAVLCFFRKYDTWTAMPYTYGVESETMPAVDYTMTLGYAFEQGFLEVFYESSSPEVNPRSQSDYRIKVVVINDFGYGKNKIDLKDWNQVRDFYGLKD